MRPLFLSLIIFLTMNPFSYAEPITEADWTALPPHPRLFATQAQWEKLPKQIQTDPISGALYAQIRREADRLLDQPVTVYKKAGMRLLGPAREGADRILTLSMVARVTGDSRYTNRAIAEMRTAAGIPSWNPSHFLDTAEITFGLAVGYDWLYGQLSPNDRKLIEEAIVEKGLKASLKSSGNPVFFIDAINNWNQVCHAGLSAGALALAPQHAELGREIVNRALTHLPIATKAYAPNGAYAEGPGYWGYGTLFHVMLTEMLRSSLGSTYATEQFEGFLESADYMAQVIAPTGRLFNYADNSEHRPFHPALFWFARERGQTDIVAPDLEKLNSNPKLVVNPLALLWWKPAASNAPSRSLPLHWVGRGANPIAIHRTAWKDPKAAYLAIKGGQANSPHAHMDAGSFIFEADGERWAVDPGMQEYLSLESKGLDIWKFTAESDRWKAFRLGPDAHNILRFNGKHPQHDGFAKIVDSRSTSTGSQSLLDLTAVYSKNASLVQRGVKLSTEGRMWIQDEWTTLDQPAEVTFQWLTQAEVTVDGTRLTLSQDGQTLNLQVITSAKIQIEVEDVSKPRAEYDAPNPKLKRIVIRTTTPARTSASWALHATPGSLQSTPPPSLEPLKAWRK